MTTTSSPVSAPASPNPTNSPQAEDNGRDRSGHFAQGNPGGPGNPFNCQVAALRKALLARVTAEDLEEIVAVLLIKAKSGDLAAIKILLAYTIGKPGPAADPDAVDQHEWRLHQQAAVPPPQVHDLMDAVPAATANVMAQVAWPCAARQGLQPVVNGLRAAEAAAAAAPSSPPHAPELAIDGAERSTAPPPCERTRPPSANEGIGDRRPPSAAEPGAGAPPSRAAPRPPDLPEHIDWEYEQRIMGILFGEEDSPPDTKRPNSD